LNRPFTVGVGDDAIVPIAHTPVMVGAIMQSLESRSIR
jgi:hypothetical protein